MKVVEVFADVRCPFTHVGLRRLVERRDESGADFTLRVRAWPLELVNGAPLDRVLVSEEVELLRAQVAPDLFAHFDAERFPVSSLPALGLAARAYAQDERVGERASLLLRDALFEEGRDVADAAVLRCIATALAVSGAEDGTERVLEDWHEGQDRGVIGSPHFFVGDADFFCPSLRIERVEGSLRIEFDQTQFDAFLDRCVHR
jgi:predicted DsbA family dithiol-disulfide isomerase